MRCLASHIFDISRKPRMEAASWREVAAGMREMNGSYFAAASLAAASQHKNAPAYYRIGMYC